MDMTGSLKTRLLLFLTTPLAFAASATQDQNTGEALRWDLSSRPAVALLLPGMSHHFQEPENPSREWNETHAGLGLEWRAKWNETGWYFKRAVGLMKDSIGSWGAYGGAVWQKRVFESDTWAIEAGGGVFLFYRALHFDGEHMWLPGALPVLSLEHLRSGLGLNIVYVPHFKTNAGEMPAVLYGQLTQRF